MSTNATISFTDSNNDTFKGTYVHWDGYPSGVGAAIVELAQQDRLNELAMTIDSVASLSSLDPNAEDLSAEAHLDVPDSDDPAWRVLGNLGIGNMSNIQEWNYIVTADRKMRIYNYGRLVSTVSLKNRTSKVNWDKIDSRDTATYRKNITL